MYNKVVYLYPKTEGRLSDLSSETYELAAQIARYIFVIIMLWIVLRALRGLLIDSRRAAKLRRLSPMTGVIGELIVTRGDGKARTGMRYPVIREGLIGSVRHADVRIRHGSVRRRHAYFQLTRKGLHLRGHAGLRLRCKGMMLRETTLLDGDRVTIGDVELLLVLSMPGEYNMRTPSAPDNDFDAPDPLFDTDDWFDPAAAPDKFPPRPETPSDKPDASPKHDADDLFDAGDGF